MLSVECMKITKDKMIEWLALAVGFTVIYFVICIVASLLFGWGRDQSIVSLIVESVLFGMLMGALNLRYMRKDKKKGQRIIRCPFSCRYAQFLISHFGSIVVGQTIVSIFIVKRLALMSACFTLRE